MKEERYGSKSRSFLVVFLCALAFVLAIGLTLLGSGIYRSAVATADENFARRTAMSYLVNQIHRGDRADGVAVEPFGSDMALSLYEGDYITLLYCYDGQLMELYTEVGTDLKPEDGVAVLPLRSLSLSMENGLICIKADGTSASVAPRSGTKEGAS